MVIRDEDSSPTPPKDKTNLNPSFDHSVAQPLDRLAASVIDYAIVLLPVIYLVLAPFQRALKVSAIFDSAVASSWEVPLITAFAAFVVIFMIFLYQCLMVWRYGATVGKLLLGLRVRSLWGPVKPSFGQSALRSFFWIFDVSCIGMPLLAILGDEFRRPLHDRVADTLVVNIKSATATAPSRNFREVALVRGVFWGMAGILALVLISLGFSIFRHYGSQDALIAQLESQNILCSQVSDAQSEWPDENGHPPSRLSVAMALYSAGVVDPHCLQAEVENLRFSSSEAPLLNLAKSFVYADTPELSDQYLARVCALAPKTLECAMSHWIDRVTGGDWNKVKDDLASLSKTKKIYPYIWAVRESMEHNNYSLALKYLNKLPDVQALSDFSTPLRVKLLWALGRATESRGAAAAAYSSLNDDARFEVAGFMCYENIWSSCDQLKSRSCQTFLQITSQSSESLASNSASLAYLRAYECKKNPHGAGAVDYAGLYDTPLSDDVKVLVRAMSEPGAHALQAVRRDQTLAAEVVAEATRRWINRISGASELERAQKMWQEEIKSRHLSLAWRKVGVALFNKYYQFHDYAMSARVGSELLSTGSAYNRHLLPLQIISLDRSHQIGPARAELAVYLAKYPSPLFAGDSRQPASVDKFAEVARELISLRSGGARGGR